MTSLRVTLMLVVLATLGSASLLEMSQTVWSRLLDGGYRKVGKLDPLRVPVVKVDQSEGNMSYRVILRNLEVTGLNASTIDSVYIVRGRLKSNLSDHEAGYVSYNDQRDLDSIRYRFHTLVKEPKSKSKDKDEDKVVEYNPMHVRVHEEDDLVQASNQESQSQKFYASPVQQQQQQQQTQNKTHQSMYGDMRVAMNGAPKNSEHLHVVYSHSYKNSSPKPQAQDENYQPCVGACRLYQESNARKEAVSYSSQQIQLAPSETTTAQTGFSIDQRYNADHADVESTTANSAMKVQFEGPGFSAETSNGERPNQFSFRKGHFGISYSDDSRNTRGPVESHSGDPVTPVFRFGYGPHERRPYQHPVYFSGFRNRPTTVEPQYSKQEHDQVRYQATSRHGYAESTTSSNTQEAYPHKFPMVRLEKQPGYVDIVYASKKMPADEPKAENLKLAPVDDPRTYGIAEIVKDLRANQRYIIHNFTEGESLRKRNDAVRVAAESKRIMDLIRYAKEYQENQGYFEEGIELIYHFGDSKNSSASNETLSRTKRQHADDKDEEDVMHVVVRIRVPMLSVKSNYALTGKVGKQLLRGNGLLTGNFTDLIADFTVELKKVNNETMVVRAARAKLTSKDRNIKLEGMDEKGPVDVILAHGLMAAEAVAAMVADDLASRALNEGSAEAMVYKMYKNLPTVSRV